MRIYNNNPAFGDEGPHEATSFEALADEMQPSFEEWADEEEARDTRGDWEDPLAPREERIAQMRREFIAGLTEVYTLAMTDGQNDQTEEVHADQIPDNIAETQSTDRFQPMR